MKPIKINDMKNLVLEHFIKVLDEPNCDTRINFTIDLSKVLEEKFKKFKKPIIHMDAADYLKMFSLVNQSDKECAWHGTVTHMSINDQDIYKIENIMSYPQTVTAATVTTDDAEYMKWLYSQTDEIFNKLRFQGHSHVNMNTSPSNVDTNYYNSMIENLTDFYIFAIMNKRQDISFFIYDIPKNIIFEPKDVILCVLAGDTNIGAWAELQLKNNIKEPPKIIHATKSNPVYSKHWDSRTNCWVETEETYDIDDFEKYNRDWYENYCKDKNKQDKQDKNKQDKNKQDKNSKGENKNGSTKTS